MHSVEFIGLATNLLTHIVDLGIDMNLQIAALIVLLLRVFVKSRNNLIALGIKTALKRDALSLNHAHKPADGALPLVTLLVISVGGLGHEEIGAVLLVLASFHRKHSTHIAQKAELHLRGIHFLVLDDFGKAVAHDGDQHVHHRQLGEESGKNEEDEDQRSLGMVAEVVKTELAQG